VGSLDDRRMPTLMGKYKVPHFDAKGEANRLFSERRIPTTFLLTSFYWENLIHFGMGPKRGEDGTCISPCPWATGSSPASPPRYRKMRVRHFQTRGEFTGKTVGIAGDHLTGADGGRPFQGARGGGPV